MTRGRHANIDKDARLSLLWLESLPMVKKVILGPHSTCRHRASPGTLKIQAETHCGVKLRAYTGNGVRDLYVIAQPLKQLPELLRVLTKRLR